jgi:hypothetical protein
MNRTSLDFLKARMKYANRTFRFNRTAHPARTRPDDLTRIFRHFVDPAVRPRPIGGSAEARCWMFTAEVQEEAATRGLMFTIYRAWCARLHRSPLAFVLITATISHRIGRVFPAAGYAIPAQAAMQPTARERRSARSMSSINNPRARRVEAGVNFERYGAKLIYRSEIKSLAHSEVHEVGDSSLADA